MRYAVALIVGGWTIGILAGAFHGPAAIGILSAAMFALWSWYLRLSVQHQVAVLLVCMLGFFYGNSFGVSRTVVCSERADEAVTLSRIYGIYPQEIRYVFTEKSGCSILVYAPRFPIFLKGTVVHIIGTRQKTSDVFSSLPEYAQFLRDQGIEQVVRRAEVDVVTSGGNTIDAFRIGIISRINTLFSEPDSSLLVAMLAGDQGMVPSEIKDAYRNSGIIHVLSISGLHVSIIALVLSFFMRKAPISSLAQSFLTAIALWMYIAGVGFPPSAVRAGIFWTLYVFGYHARALVGLLTVIILTVAVLVTANPAIVRSVGFELSVTAVAGIGVALFFFKRIRIRSSFRGIGSLLAVSIGATLATAPLTLYYFGNLSFVGMFANLLVVPLLPFVTYLALAALLLSSFISPLALIVAFFVHILMRWIVLVATLCAAVPFGHVENVRFSLVGVLLWYGALTIACVAAMKYLKIPWRSWWV